MKKVYFSCLIVFISFFWAAQGFSAESKIVESPDISIIIDTAQLEMKQNPIVVKGNTLLPLRQLLINLGVKNDSKHIKWNPKDKSIYIEKGSRTITLKVDSKTAHVNGQAVSLSAAPLIYKGSTYIPVRFVSQCLNKRVVWHTQTRSVIITDSETYLKVKEILDASTQAMKDVKKIEGEFAGNVNAGSLAYEASGDFRWDSIEKNSQINLDASVMGMPFLSLKSFLISNTMYTKSSLSEEWTKQALSKEASEQINSLYTMNTEEAVDEAYYSSFKVDDRLSTAEHTVLTGTMALGSMLNQIGSTASLEDVNSQISSTNYKMYINNLTHLVDKLEMNMLSKQAPSSDGSGQVETELTIRFTQYNGDFTISLPEEAKNAVELE